MFLVFGLGNPGSSYKNTRHNIGFLAIDYFSKRHKVEPSSKKFNCEYVELTLSDQKILLLKPQTFMNESGKAVHAVSEFYKIDSDHIIVLHDEIDLALGDIRTKSKGGHAGHNGIKSIMEYLGADNFHRIRMGVGRPASNANEEVADYVLSPFSSEQKKELPQILEKTALTLEKMLVDFQ